MVHENISLTKAEGNISHVLIGTIMAIGSDAEDTPEIGTANVAIDSYELVENVPIFYHCEDSEIVSTKHPFVQNDKVLIVNYGSATSLSTENMKIVGYEDGLPRYCGWRFKLFRDDDTTIRDGAGNITKASGILLDLFQLKYIILYGLYSGSLDWWTALPGNYGWAAQYWTYNEEDGIWYYDDTDPDYPEWAWKGTYNPDTNWFTVEQPDAQKSDDNLYWLSFECAEYTTGYGWDPAVNAAVSVSNIDNYIGVKIGLSKAGNSQTLSNPTYTTTDKKFTVMASKQNGSHTISVNGITLSAGDIQCFEWNGAFWIAIADTNITFGLNTQYPYKYKTADKYQTENKVSMGSYQDNIPYFEMSSRYYSPTPIWDDSVYCNNFNGFTIHPDDFKCYFYDYFRVKIDLKTSISYFIEYKIRDVGIAAFGENASPHTPNCGYLNALPDTISLDASITHVSGDGLLNTTQEGAPVTITSSEQSRPGSVENIKEIQITTSNIKFGGYELNFGGVGGAIFRYRRSVYLPGYVSSPNFIYEI
jgi:hypothetical protein